MTKKTLPAAPSLAELQDRFAAEDADAAPVSRKRTSEPSTEELLVALNESNAAAVAAAAPAPPPDHITLPAGPFKLAIFLPFQIAAIRNRTDRKPLPTWLVYALDDNGKVLSYHYAHAIHGKVDTFVNVSGDLPGYLPKRLPGTSGASPHDQIPSRLGWWLQSRDELTIYSEARDVVPLSVRKVTEVAPEPLPAVPRFQFKETEVAEFIEQAEAFIKSCSFAGRRDRCDFVAASALALVALALAGIDAMPVPPPRRPGDQFNASGFVDPYPTPASSIVRATEVADTLPPEFRSGFRAAVKLCGSRAMDTKLRTSCEQAGEHLIALRESLFKLTFTG